MFRDSIDYEDFCYVVQREEPAKVCFGSTMKRPFVTDVKIETMANPMTYAPEKKITAIGRLLNKPRSKKGVGGLAAGGPRFEKPPARQIPSPTRYDLRKTLGSRKKSAAPFGSVVKRQWLFTEDTPGPGTYDSDTVELCKRTKTKYNFGHVEVIPATDCFCVHTIIDKCVKCSKICPNDYWQMGMSTFLCHPCMVEEKSLHEIFNKNTLKKFKKIRNCSFKHKHEHTFAALRLLSNNKIKQWERRENYLSLYMKCFSQY